MRFLLGLLVGASLTHLAICTYQGKPPFQFDVIAWQNLIARVQAPLREQLPATPKKQHEPTVYKAESLEHDAPLHTATSAPEAVKKSEPAVQAVQVSGQQVVWTPFHSEASANGFAGRLTAQLGPRFAVDKLAPHTYVVTFSYDSERERAYLQAQVNALTGGSDL